MKTTVVQCCKCGKQFDKSLNEAKHRIKRGHNKFYCSGKCFRTIILPEKEVVDLYMSGQTLKEVGKVFGVCGETIKKNLIKAGCAMRDHNWHMSTNLNPTKGKGHSEATKEKLRQATIRQFNNPTARRRASEATIKSLASGKLKRVSKIEDLVADEFDKRGIKYKRQEPIRCPESGRYFACVDFLLNSGEVVEVNGTYWHADVRFYPTGPIHKGQIDAVNSYMRKKTKLTQLGFTIIEIWEHDINRNVIMSIDNANIQP